MTAILGILLIALLAIFWPPTSRHLNLKPGIDMVGGTSLTYEIKPPPGGTYAGKDLAVSVMESLKKRVDPEGVRNLIWRPQGSRQLEIQMPASNKTADSRKLRDAYAEAQQKLEDTNVRTSEVVRVVEKAAGADWDKDFINKMIDDHQKVLDKLQDAAKNTTNTDLRASLEKATGKVQQHLTKAQDIKANVLKD